MGQGGEPATDESGRAGRSCYALDELAPRGFGPYAEPFGLVGWSRPLLALGARIEALGPSPAAVFVEGETGTGKELIARAIPNSWANTLLHTHVAKVLPASQQTSVFTLAPAARNLGGLTLPLIASGIAIFGPAAALACAAASYVGSSLMGLKMGAITRGWKVPTDPQAAERPAQTDSAAPTQRSEQRL